MTVILTSPCLGKAVTEEYTGELESWLLSEGYARKANYTGPGVSNVGPAAAFDVTGDPTLAANREQEPLYPLTPDTTWTIANDATNLTKKTFPVAGSGDVDPGGVDNDAPTNVKLSPASGLPAGGTSVKVTADSLEGVTGVTFGGTAGTAFVLAADGNSATVVTPAHAAGAVDVVLTGDVKGTATLTGGFTYKA